MDEQERKAAALDAAVPAAGSAGAADPAAAAKETVYSRGGTGGRFWADASGVLVHLMPFRPSLLGIPRADRASLTDEFKQAFLDPIRTERYAKELADRLLTTFHSHTDAELAGYEELIEKNLAQLDELQVLLDTVCGQGRAVVVVANRADAMDAPRLLSVHALQIKADQLHEAKQLIPGLQARTMHLQQLFRQIEQIEVASTGEYADRAARRRLTRHRCTMHEPDATADRRGREPERERGTGAA